MYATPITFILQAHTNNYNMDLFKIYF